ncbi:MAG: hypothetical protein A3J65_02665 [Candidatus Buchananbacteria bacterium RIFCSPHIGHO2_02_FULL_45_11b]|uniref:UPF0102 protein A3B15_00880 n=4 Tax=Candidatus Buchananiibacteriota TaxID=1817903 RepID=A0A1G1YKJ7_9BACT|nr:MAG: hypothetical protein A2663_00735 [Candidatus Buchananbacteria bacterium RIFCSPHIGHO2_01_FULL_46_12]OGY50781.1 MAG: hypothetical protein A3J65_02665 [Candidatus Buchananbacteria bacterium RIFCSPHIGHO2_02_FULL_45_11b]OGY52829.1 MAG: hypothetical protein A3B15_00880 [Candidatus Buchananbacteria bacterium RIFCSPLOWO2_01_FULL_45_31]OGY56454.1 MAG: hypothetical protein A3H67_05305 [Candidatus Buchananbacteria bacterium RIFCSPLOWO2_02_FULL_46_11b]
MPHNQQLGRFGETIAAGWLKKNGYKILARNFRCPDGEVDLVAEIGGVIHFVEVKSRTSRICGWPEEAVGEEKLEAIAAAAENFLEQKNLEADWQIDIISLIFSRKTKTARLWWLENIS